MADSSHTSNGRTSNPRTSTVLMVSPDAVQRDELVEALRRHLGGSCRVIGAGGVREASDVLTHLTTEGTAVSLVVCAHRLPDGSGVELFGHLSLTWSRTTSRAAWCPSPGSTFPTTRRRTRWPGT